MRLTESQLREMISSAIKEYLYERGTNLSNLYHFTTIEGLEGIIRSRKFKLSGWQQDIRGGKRYMSFTRHKTPLEGYAAVNETPVRIEVSPDVLNSMHGTSIDSYEYYSPGNARIAPRCNPWRNVYHDYEEDSAKAAYRNAKANSNKTYDYGEFLNQAEECLTSDASSIYAEQAIKRIDICASWFNKTFSNLHKKELYQAFSNILRSVNSPLYKKIFIYDNMRDFSLQTDNCIPISEYSEEAFRNDLGMDNGGVQRTVAESAEGSGIHIKEKNRGKFTATKERTGKSTEELTHSKNPLTRKRAIFSQNAKKWNKGK